MFRFALTSICSFVPLLLFSQAYITTAGIRMGPSWGISVQQRLLERVTAEAVLSSAIAGDISTFSLVGKIHNSLITKNANIFMGGGIHHRWIYDLEENKTTLNGITGVAGAELTLGRVNISWDYRPMIHLDGGGRSFHSETAISLRYVFIKRLQSRKRKEAQRPKNLRNQKKKENQNTRPFWNKSEAEKERVWSERRKKKRRKKSAFKKLRR